MRQLTFLGTGSLEWREVAPPVLEGPGDAIVRPLAVATCDLDTACVHGHAPLPGPFAFGHEFVAEVLEIGADVATVAVGDRVVVPFQIGCGACDRCIAGLTGSCRAVPMMAAFGLAPLTTRDWGGAMSDAVRVPYADAMLVPLPAGIDPVAAASVSDNVPDGYRAVGGPLAERPGAPVLVVGGTGAGSVGLYAAAVAVALGSEVDYWDEDEDRLRVAEKVGARVVEGPLPAKRFGRYPVVANHAATVEGFTAALRSVDAGGVCTSTAIYFEPPTIPMLELYTIGVTLVTGRVNARATIPAVLDLMTGGSLHPELVTSQVVPWDDAAEALAVHTHKTVVTRT